MNTLEFCGDYADRSGSELLWKEEEKMRTHGLFNEYGTYYGTCYHFCSQAEFAAWAYESETDPRESWSLWDQRRVAPIGMPVENCSG